MCPSPIFPKSILFRLLNPGATRKYRRRRFEVDRWVDTSTSELSVPPVARGTCPQWLGFARQNRGCGCIRGEIGHCENAPIIPSHTPHNILGQYDGRMSKPTTASMLSMRRIRRKWYTEDKEGLSTRGSYKVCQPGCDTPSLHLKFI